MCQLMQWRSASYGICQNYCKKSKKRMHRIVRISQCLDLFFEGGSSGVNLPSCITCGQTPPGDFSCLECEAERLHQRRRRVSPPVPFKISVPAVSVLIDHYCDDISMEIFYRRWGLKLQAIDRVPSHFAVDTLPEDMSWCETRVFAPFSLAEKAKQNGQRACNHRKTRRQEDKKKRRKYCYFSSGGRTKIQDETRRDKKRTTAN